MKQGLVHMIVAAFAAASSQAVAAKAAMLQDLKSSKTARRQNSNSYKQLGRVVWDSRDRRTYVTNDGAANMKARSDAYDRRSRQLHAASNNWKRANGYANLVS